jgi:hypothetical protein
LGFAPHLKNKYAFFTQFRGPQFVKTILPRRGGNELVSGATTEAFRRVAECFAECMNRRLLSDIERYCQKCQDCQKMPKAKQENCTTRWASAPQKKHLHSWFIRAIK